MFSWLLFGLLLIASSTVVINCAVLDRDDDGMGLYYPSDKVLILTESNLNKFLYRQKHAVAVQFYNHFCGHCRAFSPTFKALAQDIYNWKNVFQLAVVDCANEVNVELCRHFEIMMYPTMRYFHENYVPGNANLGTALNISSINSFTKIKYAILRKIQEEQEAGRFKMAPSLEISSYDSYASALQHVPLNVLYTFIVFENYNSSVGQELILDTNEYQNVMVKRVLDNSVLANIAGIKNSPSLVAVKNTLEATPITPKVLTAQSLLRAINTFLRSKNLPVPTEDDDDARYNTHLKELGNTKVDSADIVYYADLEKTIKLILNTEVPRYRKLKGENLQALLNFLDILIKVFPFAPDGNLRSYLADLKNTLSGQNEWNGGDVYDLIKQLEINHAPVYIANLHDFVGCKGSAPEYRGYSCGLWTLFHTLTVSSTTLPGNLGPQVLRAMHGYVRNFFGCTECSQHFQTMAAKNRIFDVKENDKAVLWLWISHNEVNLRLAGDYTEDPEHPKIQFPSSKHCPECRQEQGAWNLPAVYQYLQKMYGADHIRVNGGATAKSSSRSIFSTLDIGMLSLLYILSFAILILVVKLFLTKRFYRRRIYKHDGRGKV